MQDRLASTETKLTLLQWMVGFNILMTTTILWKVLTQ